MVRINKPFDNMKTMAAEQLITLVLVLSSVTMVTAEADKSDNPKGYNCNDDPLGETYRGNLSKTWANHTCLNWLHLIPTTYNYTSEAYPNAGIGDHNHCRHIWGKLPAPWCWTEDYDVVWQYCELGTFDPECRTNTDDPKECYVTERAADYRGFVNVTRSGIPCQKWSDQNPQRHPYTQEDYPSAGLGNHNYCRNPAAYRFHPWCYTTDHMVEWEYCHCGLPKPTCSATKV